MSIMPDGTKAIVQAIAFTGESRTYVINLESPYDVLWDSAYLAENLGWDRGARKVATTDGFLVATSLSYDMVPAGGVWGLVRILGVNSDTWDITLMGEFKTDFDPFKDMAWPEDVTALWDATGKPTAVVKTRTGVFAFNMNGGASERWRSIWPNPSSRCHPQSQFMSDSFAVTPTRVVALANGGGPYKPVNPPESEWPHGFVGILDLQTGQAMSQHGFSCDPWDPNCTPSGPTACTDPVAANTRAHLHDVVATPSGLQAIVSGWGVVGVYHLATGQELIAWDDAGTNVRPRMGMLTGLTNQHTRNSVDATDQYAVVIGHDSPTEISYPALDQSRYRVVVIKLDSAADPTEPGWSNSSITMGPVWQGMATPGRAHDLRITPNKRKAVISIREPGTLVIPLIGQTAHTTLPIMYDTDVDPLDFGWFPEKTFPDFDAWIAQSVAVTNTRAVVIGTDGNGRGAVNVIDLTLPPGATGDVTKIDLGAKYVPTDVSMSPLGDRCLVRSVKRPTTNSNPPRPELGDPARGKITVINPHTKVFLAEFTQGSGSNPELGFGYGLNQIEAGERFGVSGGEDAIWPNPPVSAGVVNQGRIQVIDTVPEQEP